MEEILVRYNLISFFLHQFNYINRCILYGSYVKFTIIKSKIDYENSTLSNSKDRIRLKNNYWNPLILNNFLPVFPFHFLPCKIKPLNIFFLYFSHKYFYLFFSLIFINYWNIMDLFFVLFWDKLVVGFCFFFLWEFCFLHKMLNFH